MNVAHFCLFEFIGKGLHCITKQKQTSTSFHTIIINRKNILWTFGSSSDDAPAVVSSEDTTINWGDGSID
jgi:hypothetical protein